MWWKDEKFRAEIGFSLAQAHQIDKIVMPTLEQMWPLRREVDQLDKEIEKMIVESTDVMVFKQQVEKVEARRAELNKMRTVMLYRIRRVLTPEQNVKFRAAHDRREAARKKQDGDRRK
jgi:Spy/CpxP family protein refolding chaperone